MPEVRRLGRPDAAAAFELGLEAFGSAPGWAFDPADDFPGPGRSAWGAVDGEQVVAKAVGRTYESWWRGTRVPTCGIAGVAVAPEARGRGALAPLLGAVLAEAHEAGAVVSTLYPTAPGIYRSLGYELVGSYDAVEVPTSAAALVRRPEGVRLRRATAADVPAVREAYAAWAAAQHGPLTREGTSFPATDAELVARSTGITLAEAADSDTSTGACRGWVEWDRGAGYDATGVIEVHALVALDDDALRALWRMLGSFASVTGRIRLHTSPGDPARWVLPAGDWTTVSTHPYMLRVLDVAAAFSGLPVGAQPPIGFSVAGDPMSLIDGDYLLAADDGRTVCTRASDLSPGPVFEARGLGLAWAGVASCAQLRLAGLLTGTAAYDASVDALLLGPSLQLRDYF